MASFPSPYSAGSALQHSSALPLQPRSRLISHHTKTRRVCSHKTSCRVVVYMVEPPSVTSWSDAIVPPFSFCLINTASLVSQEPHISLSPKCRLRLFTRPAVVALKSSCNIMPSQKRSGHSQARCNYDGNEVRRNKKQHLEPAQTTVEPAHRAFSQGR